MADFNTNDYLSGMGEADSLAGNPPADAAGAGAGDKPAAAGSADAGSAAAGAASASGVGAGAASGAASGTSGAASGATSGASGAASGAAGATGAASGTAASGSAQAAGAGAAANAGAAGASDSDLTALGQAKKEAADYLEALQRERAEFINYRNRTAREQERSRQHGVTDVLTALLPALDDMDRIREHGGMDESFNAVATKIDRVFSEFGVEKFGKKGELFDPTRHEAVLHKPDADVATETVDTVVEAGYKLGDRVIRAARVVVAVPNPSAKDEDPPEPEKKSFGFDPSAGD